MLHDARASDPAPAPQVRHRHLETQLALRNGTLHAGEGRPADEGRADGFVQRGVHDGDVGDAGVRGADVEDHGDDLAGGEGLDGGGVGVGELVGFAEVEVAFLGGVIGLGGSDLEGALDVAVGIGGLVVVDLLATGGLGFVSAKEGEGRERGRTAMALPGMRGVGDLRRPWAIARPRRVAVRRMAVVVGFIVGG